MLISVILDIIQSQYCSKYCGENVENCPNEKEIYTINDAKIKDICESNITISPDNNYFAVGSKEGNVYIININKGEIENIINNNNGRGSIKSLFWNDLNNNIYIGDSNGFISLWGN